MLRQNQSTTENYENRNDPDLVQAFLKKWWVESDFKAPNLPKYIGSFEMNDSERQYLCTCFDNYFTYFVPVFKYCYRDSRNL
jgi:hypothetical protein